MKLKINISQVFDLANDRIGSLASRIRTKEGESVYTNAILSSREKIIVEQYIREALHALWAVAPERISDYHKDGDDYLFSINGGRDADDLTEYFNDATLGYVVAFCIARHVASVLPDYAKIYADEADANLVSLRNSIFYKSGYLTSSDPLVDTTGSVTEC